MIDLNDPQLDQHGNLVPLLTDKAFKDKIEKDCPGDGYSGLKDAKYIFGLYFDLNITELYNKTKPIKR